MAAELGKSTQSAVFFVVYVRGQRGNDPVHSQACAVRGGSNSVSVHPTLNGFTWTTSSRSSCDAWRSREVLVRYTTETGFIFSAPQKASPQPSGIIPAFYFPSTEMVLTGKTNDNQPNRSNRQIITPPEEVNITQHVFDSISLRLYGRQGEPSCARSSLTGSLPEGRTLPHAGTAKARLHLPQSFGPLFLPTSSHET